MQRIILILIAVFLALFFSWLNLAHPAEIEVAGSYTMGVEGGVTSGRFSLGYGTRVNDWLSIRMEGEIGNVWYLQNSGFQCGALTILRAERKIYSDIKIFVDGGVGVGYAQGDGKLVFSGPTGLINGGVGTIFKLDRKGSDFIIGFYYEHISSLKPADSGANLIGVRTGLRW